MNDERDPWGGGQPHEFDEDVDDFSMCMCGIPVLVHPDLETNPWQPWTPDYIKETS